jgi:hypothetical protein
MKGAHHNETGTNQNINMRRKNHIYRGFYAYNILRGMVFNGDFFS